jgi:hypothetical protein
LKKLERRDITLLQKHDGYLKMFLPAAILFADENCFQQAHQHGTYFLRSRHDAKIQPRYTMIAMQQHKPSLK